MNKRDFQREAWKVVKAFVRNEGYERSMDDLSIACSDAQWKELMRWLDLVRGVLDTPDVKECGVAPLPLIRRKIEQQL